MSLINKMLQDLESREAVTVEAVQSKPAYQGLRPIDAAPARSHRTVLWMALALVAVAGASYSVWDRLHTPAAPSGAAGAEPAKNIAAAVAPRAAEPVVVPAPVAPAAAAPAPVEPAAPIPAPAVTSAPAAPAPKRVERKRAEKAAQPKPAAVAIADPESGLVDKRVRPFTPQEKAETLYRQAVALVEQGRGDEATRQLTAALAADAGHVRARELLAGLSVKNGHWREAQQLLQDGIAKAPAYYPFTLLLARIYVDHDAESKALVLLEAAAPRAGQDPDYKVLLATLYQRAGRHADAVTVYSQLVEQRPQDGRVWLGLAISLEAEKKPDAASRAYQRARALGGLSPQLATYADQRIQALNK